MAYKEFKLVYKFVTLSELIEWHKKLIDKPICNDILSEYPICVNLKQRFLSVSYYTTDKFYEYENDIWSLLMYKSYSYFFDKNLDPEKVKIGLSKIQYDSCNKYGSLNL